MTNAIGLEEGRAVSAPKSSVCAKLEPASSNINEILEINVLQNLAPMFFSGDYSW